MKILLLLVGLALPASANRAVMENLAASNNAVFIDTINARVGVSTTTPATTLDIAGNAQFGQGITKSTFSTSGALTLAANAPLTLSGASGNVVSAASVTASAFFGAGGSITGLTPSNFGVGALPTGVTISTANVVPTFNGASNLVQMTAAGKLPAVDGTLLVGVAGINLYSLSVSSYGALGDGSDQTTAIKNAIARAKALGLNGAVGQKIWFPCGQYPVSSAINLNQSGIWIDGAGDCTQIYQTSTSTDLFQIQNVNGVRISNMSLGSAATSLSGVIHSSNTLNSVFQNVKIVGGYYGYWSEAVQSTLFDNDGCYVSYPFTGAATLATIQHCFHTNDLAVNASNANVWFNAFGTLAANTTGFYLDENITRQGAYNYLVGGAMEGSTGGEGIVVTNVTGPMSIVNFLTENFSTDAYTSDSNLAFENDVFQPTALWTLVDTSSVTFHNSQVQGRTQMPLDVVGPVRVAPGTGTFEVSSGTFLVDGSGGQLKLAGSATTNIGSGVAFSSGTLALTASNTSGFVCQGSTLAWTSNGNFATVTFQCEAESTTAGDTLYFNLLTDGASPTNVMYIAQGTASRRQACGFTIHLKLAAGTHKLCLSPIVGTSWIINDQVAGEFSVQEF